MLPKIPMIEISPSTVASWKLLILRPVLGERRGCEADLGWGCVGHKGWLSRHLVQNGQNISFPIHHVHETRALSGRKSIEGGGRRANALQPFVAFGSSKGLCRDGGFFSPGGRTQ